MKNDLISRQAAINEITEYGDSAVTYISVEEIKRRLEQLPPAQPTLYGYKIEHLAYIARVMEKEGVTADYAVRTFDDIGRAVRMIIEEVQERVMETYERYSL